MHMESEELGNFFVRSILIDVITTLGNAMNQAHIKFDTFSEVYYETIYLCRSCSYHENETLINANIEKLLTVYEESANDISIGRIEKIIQDSFENPDFSITDLANTFHVSAAYMSFLFKKEKNVGFAEYLWKLRLNKAQKLLTDTDMSIESVSAAVGYLNVSSFRRKFKQDMGVTPLQYRNGSDS